MGYLIVRCTVILLVLCILLCPTAFSQSNASAETFDVSIEVNAAETLGELKPIWRFFGADEPNYASMKDGNPVYDWTITDRTAIRGAKESWPARTTDQLTRKRQD